MYGWQPAGTKFNTTGLKDRYIIAGIPKKLGKKLHKAMIDNSRRKHDPHDYLQDDLRKITAQDAKAMAAALREALDDIPDHLPEDTRKHLTPGEMIKTFPAGMVGFLLKEGVEKEHMDPMEVLGSFSIPDPDRPIHEVLGGDFKPEFIGLIEHLESGELFIA